jgi:SGNH domain (fused to AT3 domains)
MTRTTRGLLGVLAAWVLVLAIVGTAWIVHRVEPQRASASIHGVHHTGRPLRVLLVGDSMAGTLGLGLAVAAPAMHVDLINAADVGCSVAIAYDGAWASSIWVPAAPNPPCQSKQQFRAFWKGLLVRYSPDVVIYLSRMDTVDQEIRPGQPALTSVLDASFDAYLTSSIRDSVALLSSTGAHVILGTSPPTLFNLQGNAYDNPLRWARYEKTLDDVAATSHGNVSVFNFTTFFGGKRAVPLFQLDSSSGIRWRCGDGIHFTKAGGILVAPSLFGSAWAVGGPRRAEVPTLPPISKDVVNQPWPPFAGQAATMRCTE